MLKCEDHDSFLSFYLKTKGILRKLNNGNSIAIKDDVFIKAYFFMAIEATELQTEVKGFLRGTSVTYLETLELIHVDLRFQTTGEHLRETMMRSGSMDIMRKGKTDDYVNPKKADTPLNKTVSFPNNHDELLPSEYY